MWQRLRDHIDRELEWSRGRDWSHWHHSLLASFDGPARAIRCACTIALHAARMGIRMRAGLHIGECEIAAAESFAARRWIRPAESREQAEADEILVSATVRDLVAGSGIRFRYEGSS